ncbi:MAG: T9SS type A sorting domain-containing protein [Bacteroidales bacterium]|nr:T9SS type A sorting domain-containing protein [Bacteroidales bacterium]
MKTILMLALVALELSVYSQEFINDNKIWSNVIHGNEYGCEYISFFIRFKGDTLINDLVYKKVQRSNDSLMNDWITQGAIRETDSGSVYYVSQGYDQEILLYDFGVSEGDSIKLNDDYLSYLFVDSVRYKPFGRFNEVRKHFYIRRDNCDKAVWISGIGCTRGVLYDPGELCKVGETSNLVCFFENDSLKYHFDYYSNCFPYGKYTFYQTPTTPKIQIFTQSDEIIVKFDEISTPGSNFLLFDINGRIVSSNNSQLQQCSIIINKNLFRSGIYIYQLQTEKGIYTGMIYIN